MITPTDRIRLSVDAVQHGWAIAQHANTAIFALDDSVLVVHWSDADEAIDAELSRAGRVQAYARSSFCADVAAWVEQVLADVPASKGAVA